MIFNLVHKPDLSESYRFMRECAHELKLKTTILINSSDLSKPEIVEQAKQDNRDFGDEIGIWLRPEAEMPPIWLISEEDKRETVKFSVEKFKELFGYAPKVLANYVMDAQLMKIIRELCPECTTCVAGCFEEGVKVFHGCNNSWYLFSEGMNWGPWYPSKSQSIRPAENEEDWAGLVALPHLARDLDL